MSCDQNIITERGYLRSSVNINMVGVLAVRSFIFLQGGRGIRFTNVYGFLERSRCIKLTKLYNGKRVLNQHLGTHLPNIPDSENVSGCLFDGSANIPPTPGPITCPSANAAGGHKVPPRYSQTSEHGYGGGVRDW